MRAAIYARYSTDKQRESSIADQSNVCQKYADAEGFTVSIVHGDDGVSGSMPVAQRHGGAKLLADALADRFDVLIVEGLDRLSRDQVEQERIVRRLEHRGINIIGVSDGYDSRMGARKIMRGVRGLINELYLDDLRHKTHRGQSGQVDRGFVAGGKSYGYRTIKTEQGSHFEIDEEQATWVRWIFTNYEAGWSVQRIAHELNRLGVKSPRGGTWAVSAIYGSPNKGSGILNNELYAGRYIWNRSQWVKDPDSGRCQRIDRPADEWKITDVPELIVIDQALWNSARTRMDETRLTTKRGKHGNPRTLFGGLMKCPYCDGAIVAINPRLYGCAANKDRGASVCKGIYFPRKEADMRLIGVLRSGLLSASAQQEFEEQFRAAITELRRNDGKSASNAKDRIAELDTEIGRMVDAIAMIGMSDAIMSRLKAAEKERGELAASVASPGAKLNHSEMVSKAKQTILNLQAALTGDVQTARKIIGNLMGEIRITEREKTVYAEYDNATEKLVMASSGVSIGLVAGAGFEPTTFGL